MSLHRVIRAAILLIAEHHADGQPCSEVTLMDSGGAAWTGRELRWPPCKLAFKGGDDKPN